MLTAASSFTLSPPLTCKALLTGYQSCSSPCSPPVIGSCLCSSQCLIGWLIDAVQGGTGWMLWLSETFGSLSLNQHSILGTTSETHPHLLCFILPALWKGLLFLPAATLFVYLVVAKWWTWKQTLEDYLDISAWQTVPGCSRAPMLWGHHVFMFAFGSLPVSCTCDCHWLLVECKPHSPPPSWDQRGQQWKERGVQGEDWGGGWRPRNLEVLHSFSFYGLHQLSKKIKSSVTKQRGVNRRLGSLLSHCAHSEGNDMYVFCVFSSLTSCVY